MQVPKLIENARNQTGLIRDAARSRNPKVWLSLLGPAIRGFLLQKGKHGDICSMPVDYEARFLNQFGHDRPELAKLYQAAKKHQWESDATLPWSRELQPGHPDFDPAPDEYLPLRELKGYRSLPAERQAQQRMDFLSWMMSQFMHGEQGALYAACQVTECIDWADGKLYGATQVMDEGRHLEVFTRYLDEKLEKRYEINDNLYVIIDALMSDSRWDLKFLCMQVMIEGLALGAFSTLRNSSRDPLLRELLKYVIFDEGRHVHFGTLSLRDYYSETLAQKEVREREDWAFEVSLLLRNRFLAHEFYEEHYAHAMSRKEWDRFVLESDFMRRFRDSMFKRIVPNLRKINLLSDRVKPHYEAIGLLKFANDKDATQLSQEELLS